ncbi:hypothetical protein BDZ45DRAFT_730410 [Acephala macrosclerotiorum]|nr:hypothetical protein BDZ45DRAFT_730410 [Acephala macrosclerotiorum]
MVSSDTALAITFGLISVIISLISMLIAYLTLRATTAGKNQDIDRLYENGTTFRHNTHTTCQKAPPRPSRGGNNLERSSERRESDKSKDLSALSIFTSRVRRLC